jgi:phosphate starvation-inducible protein PhoH
LSHREKQVLEFRDNDEAMAIMGKFDCHINLLEDSFQVTVIPQGNRCCWKGPRLPSRAWWLCWMSS